MEAPGASLWVQMPRHPLLDVCLRKHIHQLALRAAVWPVDGIGAILSTRMPVLVKHSVSCSTEGYENLLSPSDMTHIKSDTLTSKHSELKDRLRSINQGLDRLRKVSHQGYGSTTGKPWGQVHGPRST